MPESAFDGLKFLVQYRRKDDGAHWCNMAAFDGELAAARYFKAQNRAEDWPWEYQLVNLEDAPCTTQ